MLVMSESAAASLSCESTADTRWLRVGLLLLAVWIAAAAHPETRAVFLSSEGLSALTRQFAGVAIAAVAVTLLVFTRSRSWSAGAGAAALGGACLVLRGLVPELSERGAGSLLPWLSRSLPPLPTILLCLLAYTLGVGLLVVRPGQGLSLRIGAATLALLAALTVYRSGIPAPALLAAVVTAAGSSLLEAVRRQRIRPHAYVAITLPAAVAALIALAHTNQNLPAGDSAWRELALIGAVALGGTSFAGTPGSPLATLLGALVLGVASTGMNVLAVGTGWQLIVAAALVVAGGVIGTPRVDQVQG